jgi:hypothetical protein
MAQQILDGLDLEPLQRRQFRPRDPLQLAAQLAPVLLLPAVLSGRIDAAGDADVNVAGGASTVQPVTTADISLFP